MSRLLPQGFCLVAAVDEQNGIGLANQLPWHLPPDLKHFKQLTSDTSSAELRNAVVMGRNTWSSLPGKVRPLPNRLNFVVSSTLHIDQENCTVTSSLDEALCLAQARADLESTFVIGGGQLYAQALMHPACQAVYLTRIHAGFNCDVFLPKLPDHFICTDRSELQKYENLSYRFETYTRSSGA